MRVDLAPDPFGEMANKSPLGALALAAILHSLQTFFFQRTIKVFHDLPLQIYSTYFDMGISQSYVSHVNLPEGNESTNPQ